MLEPLETAPAKGPAAATELHLAPAEFNVTVHGETYHVEGVRVRTKDRRPQTLLHPGQRQTRRSLVGSHPGSPGRRAGSTRRRQRAPNPNGPGRPSQGRGASHARPRRQSARRDRCQVKAGDPLLIIEAMKMESQVPAPIDGRVTAILVAEGDNVKTDETVIQLE